MYKYIKSYELGFIEGIKDALKDKNKIFNILITLALLVWIGVIVYDFLNVQSEKEPKFCFTKGETKNDDGNVKWCKGAGYVAYKYDYGDITAYEFGPFWQEIKTKSELEARGK